MRGVARRSTGKGRGVGTVHKSIRLNDSLMKRIDGLISDGETQAETIRRVLVVGCDVLESGREGNTDGAQQGTDESTNTRRAQVGARVARDESTQRLIEYLEREIERLEAEHKADREAIAQKDEQIAQALEKAHELTEQAHVLMGMQTKTEILPAPTSSPLEDEPQAGKEQPKSWWQRWFG